MPGRTSVGGCVRQHSSSDEPAWTMHQASKGIPALWLLERGRTRYSVVFRHQREENGFSSCMSAWSVLEPMPGINRNREAVSGHCQHPATRGSAGEKPTSSITSTNAATSCHTAQLMCKDANALLAIFPSRLVAPAAPFSVANHSSLTLSKLQHWRRWRQRHQSPPRL